ncbi:MAG TPA: DUF5683 domain-containing protein, partial [Bacteroidota bacterium]|nr:DUF5683 domain-containing protein [Bacteroidota bacterium]
MPILLFVSTLSYSQTDSTKSTPADTTRTSVAPSQLGPRIETNSDTQVKDAGTGFHNTKDPWLAFGLSAVVPGAGQIYNHNYWKAPVIWGLTGFCIGQWLYENRE